GFGFEMLAGSGHAFQKNYVLEWMSPLRAPFEYWFVGWLVLLGLLWLGLLGRFWVGGRNLSRGVPVIDLGIASVMTGLSFSAVRFVSELAVFAFPIVVRSVTLLFGKLVPRASVR